MRALAILLLIFGLAVPAVANDKPDPEKPVSIDFVKKSLKAVVEWCAARADAKVEFAQNFKDGEVTVSIKDRKPLEIAREACGMLGYELIVAEKAWTVKKPDAAENKCEVTTSTSAGRFHAIIKNEEAVSALMTVAKIAEVQIFVPTLAPGRPNWVPRKNVTIEVRFATADYLLREIARQANFVVEFKTDGKLGERYEFAHSN